MAEVTLAVQFSPLLELTAVHMGKLSEIWADDYPGTEEHDEVGPLPDEGTAARQVPSFQISVRHRPLPRTWFLDTAAEHVVQVQRDRLVLNWRRQGSAYPHYAQLMPRFRKVYEEFGSFLEDSEVGVLTANQCHVTYINPIPLAGAQGCPAGLSGLLAGWTGEYSTQPLLDGGDTTIQVRYPLTVGQGERIGSLYVRAGTALNVKTEEPVLLLDLTARGRPSEDNLDGVVSFLNLGHHAIVTMFDALTTPEMHRLWGKRT